MSAEVKVLSTSTRTNLEALKHYMKKLGFRYCEEKGNWVDFGTRLFEDLDGKEKIDACNHISIMTNHKDLFCVIDGLEVLDKLPEAKQAILDFYKAEGISDED
jgi:hypothetical protein